MSIGQWVAGLFRGASEPGDAPRRGPADDFWYEPPGGDTGAGLRVTPEIAIKASAVFACGSLLARVIASLPFRIYRLLPGGGQEQDADHPLDELIRYQPNDVDTAVDFWQQMVWHMVLRGTAYAEIVPGRRGAIGALVPLHPDCVSPQRLEGQYRWRYEVRDPATGLTRMLLQDEVLRIPGLIAGGVQGMPLTSYAGEAIAIGMAADQYAARVFRNNLNVGLILTHPGKLSEEGRKNFVSAWMQRFAGAQNAHRPVFLQEGIKVEKVGQTAAEAQLTDARKWQILELARFLGIPPHMLGINEGATHANVEEQSINFVRYTLQPWAKRIEQAVRRDLIVPDANDRRTHKAEYNFDSLLRGNAQARAEYFSRALGAGGAPPWMTQDEVRAIEGLNPRGGEADQLALGTNPGAPSGPARPSDRGDDAQSTEALPEKEAPPRLSAPGTEERCAALIRKEVRALGRAAMRHAGDVAAWRGYAEAFYASQISDVVARFGVHKDIARRYCAARTEQCRSAATPQSGIDHIERHGAAELAAAVSI